MARRRTSTKTSKAIDAITIATQRKVLRDLLRIYFGGTFTARREDAMAALELRTLLDAGLVVRDAHLEGFVRLTAAGFAARNED